jgi:hypothetical protein
VKVQGPRKTKLLQLKNTRFFRGNKQISHSDPDLSSSDCVSITFEEQKRDTKNDPIMQHKLEDKLLCPVRVWASLILRVNSYYLPPIQSIPSDLIMAKFTILQEPNS